MQPKLKEKMQARHLRKRGLSLSEIVSTLKISRSSASTWVRNVKLTKKQTKFLKYKSHLKDVIKKRVETRLKNENARRRLIMDAHKRTLTKNIDLEILKILGTTLYWAEGGKSQKQRMFNFYNSDPHMIKVMAAFLKYVCKIPEDKFRGHINLHTHLDANKAERYWSSVSKIPRSQFYKTTKIISKASKNTRDTLPYGTFSIQICSTDLFLKMLAWIEAVSEKVINKYN
ncbi:MAG: hypothetical protein A3J46_00140 [Candidatus Yanofskybacteria bacterium RIFCSPHIGHO2_02_FULL_41_11]|uniref:Uncharacterized protein n=1 Tax=Candidatus Yanofskybacteria bacterium RIFCSPHIGHO2_02_FULL_41_11 TaxID=1802675 RepID=A0A1F8F8Y9_9BACT|nr:MAG: hypothetical protein A3J46_00140 [Candidatus Yanofskybacteria bacterium RIFCSPHIGHO2_02_FULL_41_11]